MHKYKLRMWDGQRESFGSLQIGPGSDGNVSDYRAGDSPISVRKLPGRTKYDEITLDRGVTHDSAFTNWAAAVAASTSSGSAVPSHRSLELSDESGQPVLRYNIHGGSLTVRQLVPPGGVILHNLQLRDGKSLEEKLLEILEDSLSRLSRRP